ncbi:MAG TPA: porin [Polyangiaceae bacterium]|nr:porin [Polyangiaceae bacterium]
MVRGRCASLIAPLVVVWTSAAAAQTPTPDESYEQKYQEQQAQLAEQASPAEQEKKKTFKPKARLFVLGELSRHNVLEVNAAGVPENKPTTDLDLSVQSARVGFEYRSPLEWLTLEVQAELAGKLQLKDAVAEAKQKHWDVRVGQFKMPIGVFEMDSPWDLPIVHRGFVNTLLVDRLDVAGRRPGLTVGVRAGGPVKPSLTVGAFQGSALAAQTSVDRDVDLITEQGTDSQTEIARAQIKVEELKFGLAYQHRLGAPSLGKTKHYWTAGADAYWEWLHAAGGFRVWADALAGESWYEHVSKAVDGKEATFLTLRALVAYRFGGAEKGDFYVEPFLFGAAHDPDSDVVADQAVEAMLGLAAGYWDRARLTFQGEIVRTRRNFPDSYSVSSDPNRLALLLQAGVAF